MTDFEPFGRSGCPLELPTWSANYAAFGRSHNPASKVVQFDAINCDETVEAFQFLSGALSDVIMLGFLAIYY